jgi:hypothetical protein
MKKQDTGLEKCISGVDSIVPTEDLKFTLLKTFLK